MDRVCLRRPTSIIAWFVIAKIVVAKIIVAMLVLSSFGLAIPGSAGAADDIEREVLTFDDIAAIDELTADHASLFRLYWAFFDRAPDAAGGLYWIEQLEQCTGLALIVESFAAGSEFAASYGTPSDAGFLDLIYRNVLDRAPDDAGRNYWLRVLSRGTSTRAELMLYFSASPEFVASHPMPSDLVPSRGCRLGGRGPNTPRTVALSDPVPFASYGPVTLLTPSVAVERIGFHESMNDAARPLESIATTIPSSTLSSRNRDTPSRGAADVVVHPMLEVTSPVTGTVLRSGGYTLYCRYRDDYVVIEPDRRPGWEVKVLHIDGVQVLAGDRVEAGVTILAPRPQLLAFSSQIDDLTANPSWPHVHIEIVDPSIPDRPNTGRGC